MGWDTKDAPRFPDPLGSPLGRAAFEAAREGLMVLAAGGTVLAANRALHDLFSLGPEELVGRRHTALREELGVRLVGECTGPEMWIAQRALRGGTMSGVLQQYRLRNGRDIECRCGATPVHEEGRLTATVVSYEDYTALGKELDLRVEAGVRALHKKEEFSLRLGHGVGRVVTEAARELKDARRRLLADPGAVVSPEVRDGFRR